MFEYKIVGMPTRIVYKKKDNGLYEATVENYIIETPTGERYTAKLQIPNCSFNAEMDEGIILLDDLDYIDLKQLYQTMRKEKTNRAATFYIDTSN